MKKKFKIQTCLKSVYKTKDVQHGCKDSYGSLDPDPTQTALPPLVLGAKTIK